MSNRVVYRSFNTVLLPFARTGRQTLSSCSAKKKKGSRTKTKRSLKPQDASRELPAQPEHSLECQDEFHQHSFASVQPPDIKEQTLPAQPMRNRQGAVDGGAPKSVNPADSTSQQVSSQRLEKENVLTVCRVTSFGMAVIGVLATIVTPTLLEKAGSGIHSISQNTLLHVPSVTDIGIAVAVGCGITATAMPISVTLGTCSSVF